MQEEGVKITARNNNVEINMRVNSYVFIFGLPAMITFIILGTVVVSNIFISSKVPDIHVDAPRVEALLSTPPPIVQNVVKPCDVPISVQLPQSPAPIINMPQTQLEAPRVTVQIPSMNGDPKEVKTVERVIEKQVKIPVYVYVDSRDKAHVTIDDIVTSAEKYVQSYCNKVGKDYSAEQKKWLDMWTSRVQERGGDEQKLFLEALIEKRGGFDVNAQPQDIAEVCRLLVRYRDGKLALPELFKQHMTAENLAKLKQMIDNNITKQ